MFHEDPTDDASSFTPHRPVNFAGQTMAYVYSSALAQSNGIGVNSKLTTDLLDVVSLTDVPFGSYTNHIPQDPEVAQVIWRHAKTVTDVDITIGDIYGDKLSYHDNFDTTVVVKVISDQY